MDNETKDWSIAIGSLIVAFGNFEHFVVNWIRDNFDEVDAEALIKLRLAQKIELIENKILSLTDIDEKGKEIYLDSLAQMKALNKIRNQVAHNPLMIQLYIDDSQEYFDSEYRLTHSSTNRDLLSLEEVSKAAALSEELVSKLYEAQVRVQLDAEPPLPITK